MSRIERLQKMTHAELLQYLIDGGATVRDADRQLDWADLFDWANNLAVEGQ